MFENAIILYGSSFWETAATQNCSYPQGILLTSLDQTKGQGLTTLHSAKQVDLSRHWTLEGFRKPDQVLFFRYWNVEPRRVYKKNVWPRPEIKIRQSLQNLNLKIAMSVPGAAFHLNAAFKHWMGGWILAYKIKAWLKTASMEYLGDELNICRYLWNNSLMRSALFSGISAVWQFCICSDHLIYLYHDFT